MIPDSAYRLEVKIRKNETCARIKLNQSSIPWFEGEMLEVVNNKIRPAASSLAISIRLTQKKMPTMKTNHKLWIADCDKP